MKNQLNRTREQIVEHLRRTNTPYMAQTVRRVMDGFGTIEGFLNADKPLLLQQYRRERPGSHRDLGARFFAAHEECRRFCAEEPEQRTTPPLDPTPAPALVAPPATPQPSARFSFALLKGLVEIMDLCGIAEVDVPKMALFLDACGAKMPTENDQKEGNQQ